MAMPMARAIRIMAGPEERRIKSPANILDGLTRVDPANAVNYEDQQAGVSDSLNRQLAVGDELAPLRACQSSPITIVGPYFARRFRWTFVIPIEIKRACRLRRRTSPAS